MIPNRRADCQRVRGGKTENSRNFRFPIFRFRFRFPIPFSVSPVKNVAQNYVKIFSLSGVAIPTKKMVYYSHLERERVSRWHESRTRVKKTKKGKKVKMKAIMANDKCFSTAATGNRLFNTDGVERTTLTVEEARTAFDFDIEKRQSYAFDPATGKATVIPNHYHLVSSDTGDFIPCPSVGAQFNPVQHRDVFEYVTTQIMPNLPNMELEMCGTIHGRGVGIIAAKMGDAFSIKGDESPNVMRMLYANPCTGTGRLVMGFTTVRIVCQNTLMAARRQAEADGWKIKHTKNAEIRCTDALKSIEQAAQAALEMKRRSERLAEIGCGSAMLERALDEIYPLYGIPQGSLVYQHVEKMRERVKYQFEAGETAQTMTGNKSAWTLLNSFTYDIFNGEKISKKSDRAEIAYRGMVGNVGEKVNQIFDKVERIAVAA